MINIKTEKIKNQNKRQSGVSLKTKFNDFSSINKNIFNNKKIVIGISPQKYLIIFIVIPRNLVRIVSTYNITIGGQKTIDPTTYKNFVNTSYLMSVFSFLIL